MDKDNKTDLATQEQSQLKNYHMDMPEFETDELDNADLEGLEGKIDYNDNLSKVSTQATANEF